MRNAYLPKLQIPLITSLCVPSPPFHQFLVSWLGGFGLLAQLLLKQTFITEKKKLIREDSFRDGIGNLKAKAKKHQILEREIKANAVQLKVLNRTGQQMIQRNNFKAKHITKELENVNNAWEELMEAVKEQGSKLEQAEAQNVYNRMKADSKTKWQTSKVL